ncbi:DUF5916 domain-containing protein [Ulvibacter antarcticus]|uniref:DUF5916 domain-containing protein n=1 Tax=Ulvibacter antarcticus TaxID=442714 RepID=A0A3L9YW12_9FLAO|nr:DUF5916 domain-containing protein [Ulvibacter antarcticus]RMA64504.1 hypothetical protein BXY75_1380 [Ulvibacter antarcticus]
MFRYITTALFIITATQLLSQTKKSIEAIRIETPPKIDGILDDTVWDNVPIASDFFMYEPGNEGKAPFEYNTEVKIAYDNKAVYVAAYMFDPNPSLMFNQFSQRDDVFVQADHFSVALNTNNDGINETHFYVTSAGTIGDAIAIQSDFDFSYDVVFDCKVSKDSNGWYAEFKIPYNALRFPEIEVQNWAVNFYRKQVARNETYTWNRIDKSVGAGSQYSGLVSGVTNIDPPVRLTLFPFAQGVVSTFDGNTDADLSAGMDIKYGLSDSFTLDATLIPDFGQTAFDEVELNLGPFEQTFDENRQFFTEGIDLFRKGNIFFSRRVGGKPSVKIDPDEDLASNEKIITDPERVNLLNAIKVSGRTKGNLGVGFFNAITEKTYAVIRDTITGATREILVEPLANYNILVLDQQFNGNSFISIINTNVTRENKYRDANTSAFVFSLADNDNVFRASGRAIMSQVSDLDGNSSGFLSELDIYKIKGKFRYRIGHDFANKTFDINDLGVNFTNNFNNFVAGASYEIFEPTPHLNKYKFELTARHNRLYKPSVKTDNQLALDMFFVNKSRFGFGGNFSYSSDYDNYFEPRVDGRFVTFSSNLGGRIWISSDYRKTFALDMGIGYRNWFDDPKQNIFVDFAPRYRFSDRLLLILSTDLSLNNRDFGYIANNETDIFFGQRDIINLETELTATYNFDPFKAIDLRFRNFWSSVDYGDNVFYTLNRDGTRRQTSYDISEENPNRNFNIWNLDVSFRWRFAPGSEASLLYRNQIFNQDEQSTIGYTKSLSELFNQPQQHTVSLRLTYFIDYNNIGTVFNKNS